MDIRKKLKEAFQCLKYGVNKENNIYYPELENTAKTLTIDVDENDPPSVKEWKKFMLDIKKNILSGDLANFLNWEMIRYTMFINEGDFLQKELDFLKKSEGWERYKVLLRESIVGNPESYKYYPLSSGNLIHHAYQVAFFEKHINLKINELDVVFEFGGGYGSMARVFQNANFKGKYILFDTPLVSALQKYYLQSSGYKVESSKRFDRVTSGIFLITDTEELFEILDKLDSNSKNCFWATWSFSEAPIALREEFAPHLSPFNYQFIACQDAFHEAANKPYFFNYVTNFKQLDCQIIPFDLMVGQSFLIIRPSYA